LKPYYKIITTTPFSKSSIIFHHTNQSFYQSYLRN
jgi:hypothetical protein